MNSVHFLFIYNINIKMDSKTKSQNISSFPQWEDYSKTKNYSIHFQSSIQNKFKRAVNRYKVYRTGLGAA